MLIKYTFAPNHKILINMKKITLLALLITTTVVMAQTQRFVVFEEFTQASCGPCASQNPAFNALLASNSTKTIGLKYQTSWPGFDPMNLHNPTEVATRVTYYGVSGVPYCRMDGSTEPTGSAYAGAPANVTQNMINTRYAITSPFEVTVSHTVNNALDSAFITVVVKNVSGSTLTSGSAGSLKLHVIIAEEEINFNSAPGSNGEKDFYGVMKKMVTTDAGLAMADSWTNNQTQTFTYDVALPSYMYNLGEVAIVSFVQENTTKEILQGDYSAPQPLPSNALDAGISDISLPLTSYCQSSWTPQIEVTNYSTPNLTTMEVWYAVNGGTPVMTTWTGSLTTGQKTTHYISPITLTGPTTFECWLKKPNGGADYNNMNNIIIPANLNVVNVTPVMVPSLYTLETITNFETPANMIVEGDAVANVWVVDKSAVQNLQENLGAFEGSEKSLVVDFYSMAVGKYANIVTEKVSLSGLTNSKLYFDHAYAQYASENDKLQVYISDDCGATWTNLFDKAGSALADGNPPVGNNARFWPKANHWNRNTLDISAFDGKDVIVKFTATSDFGNMMYLDNILVNDQEISQVGIEEVALASVKFYPNPASDILNVELNLEAATDVSVNLINELGQVVLTSNTVTMDKVELNVSELANGVYTVKVLVDNKVVVKRISIVK